MNSGKILAVLFVMLCSFSGYAQQSRQSRVEVKGVVVEEGNKEPIEQATVRLLSVKDSSLVGGVASGRDGSFSIKNVRPGEYLLHISYIGFDPLYQPLQITGQRNPANLGRLEMADGSIRLGEAVVVGKAAEIVVKNDTIEYNADSYKVTEGSMLEDLLKRMQGVEVDSDGKITINGKEISKILVDGKEFFSDDPKVASKNLPADMIDKIQTYEKKSDMSIMTGFDDGDEENVINLTIKPGMKQGWFGQGFAGYGSEDRYEANAIVNRLINNNMLIAMGGINNTNNMGSSDIAGNTFSGLGGGGGRRGGGPGGGGGAGNGITTSGNLGLFFNTEFTPKLTLNGDVRYTHSDRDARSTSRTENILTRDSSIFENDHSFNDAIGNTIAANFRMEWKPDTETTIIFRPRFSYNKSENTSSSDVFSYDQHGDSIYTIDENYYSKGDSYDVNAQLEYSRKLNDEGRVISFSISGGYSDLENNGDNESYTHYYSLDDSVRLDQKFKYENSGYNYRGYVSFVEPIGRNNFIQATYSFSQNKQESLRNTYTSDVQGFYNILDSAYSQSYENNFITQRASLSFRAQREKYNYTIGLNVDPSYNSSHTFVGDSTVSRISRNVVNLSPSAQFNYLWDRRTNLRINYNGRTTQPSMTQLQPVQVISSATNITVGNPDLKPTYTNNLSARYQSFNAESQRSIMLMLNGNYTINAIASKSIYADDGSGNRITTYENVNGNFNSNLRMMINSPLRNRKFSYSTMTMAGYSESRGFINADKNKSREINLQERLRFDFRSDVLDLGINGNVNFNNVSNSLQNQNDQATWNYGVGGNTTIYLPLNFKIESDINYSAKAGYSDGYNQKEVLWNAAASKSFLKNNQGTIRFKIYDILQQRNNVSRNVTASYIRDSEYNTLKSFFMFQFIYRFQIFSGGASMDDMRRGPRGGGPSGPGGPPPVF